MKKYVKTSWAQIILYLFIVEWKFCSKANLKCVWIHRAFSVYALTSENIIKYLPTVLHSKEALSMVEEFKSPVRRP